MKSSNGRDYNENVNVFRVSDGPVAFQPFRGQESVASNVLRVKRAGTVDRGKGTEPSARARPPSGT